MNTLVRLIFITFITLVIQALFFSPQRRIDSIMDDDVVPLMSLTLIEFLYDIYRQRLFV